MQISLHYLFRNVFHRLTNCILKKLKKLKEGTVEALRDKWAAFAAKLGWEEGSSVEAPFLGGGADDEELPALARYLNAVATEEAARDGGGSDVTRRDHSAWRDAGK